MAKKLDLTGQVFHYLTAIKFAFTTLYRSTYWECKCKCGKILNVATKHLRSGNIKSCGCHRYKAPIIRIGRPKDHGHRSEGMSPTYKSWNHMMQRCSNPKNSKYYMYGGKGITVCDEWKDFNNFLRDMGERPENTTIDRIDSTKGYYPENCRWADVDTQSKNRNYFRD